MMRLLLSLFLLVGQGVLAYAPTADFIIAEMAAKHCISGRASFNGIVSSRGQADFVSAELNDDGLTFAKRSSVLANEKSQKKSAVDAKKDEPVSLYFASKLIGCKKGAAMVMEMKKYLTGLGIDVKKEVAHGLEGNEPVFIIGATSDDQKSAQLWVEKKTYLPVREKVLGRETVFDKWAVINTLDGKKFPSLITTTKDGAVEKLSISEKVKPTQRGNDA